METLTEKEFIERVENLDLEVEKRENLNLLIIRNKQGSALAHINRKKRFVLGTDYSGFSELHIWTQNRLSQALTELAHTPIDERKKEENYLYKSAVKITNASDYYVLRELFTIDTLVFDGSGRDYALKESRYHFTEEEVEEYSKNERYKAMFDICERELVE